MGPGHRPGDRQDSRAPPQLGTKTGLPSPRGPSAGAHANQACTGTRDRRCPRRPHSRCSGKRRVNGPARAVSSPWHRRIRWKLFDCPQPSVSSCPTLASSPSW
jgi:hypothetical protein